MAVGFKVYRDDGTIQVDDEYKTLSLKEIQTVNIAATDPTPTFHTITVTADNAMVAVRTEQLHYSTYATWVSGTSWNITFQFRADSGTVGETVRFYIFTDPVITAGEYLRVWNAAGALVFSDSTRPVRIKGVVSGTSGFSGTPGRIYAPILLARPDGMIYYNGVLWDIYYYFYRCSGHTISASQKVVRRINGVRRTVAGQYLAADVTDY